MKKSLLFLACASIMALTACSSNTNATTAAETSATEAASSEQTSAGTTAETAKVDFSGRTLNVVATSDKYKTLFDEFTNQTGAKVEFLSMSSGEFISRAKA